MSLSLIPALQATAPKPACFLPYYQQSLKVFILTNEGILNLTITNDRASNDTTFSFSHFQHCCKFLLWQQLVKITTLLPKAFFAALDAWLVPQRSSKGHPSERCKGPTYVSPPFGNTRIYLASNHIFKVAASTKLLPDTYLIHLV